MTLKTKFQIILSDTGDGRDGDLKKAEICENLFYEEMHNFLEWVTREECRYAIMYGGTPELEKDLRFSGVDENDDHTIKEMIEIYKKEKGL